MGGSFSDPNFDLCFANQDKMKCIVIFLLFQGGDILELSTQERHCPGIPEQYTADMKQGAFFPDRHQLLLICSNSVVVFDLLKNVVVLSWETPCVFDAKIIGNGLYVCALGGVSRLEIP